MKASPGSASLQHLVQLDDRRHEENRRLFAAERTLQEDLIGRVIAASRLPLRIVPAGKSFGVEHVDGAWIGHQDEPKEYGTGDLDCPLPGESPADLVRPRSTAWRS